MPIADNVKLGKNVTIPQPDLVNLYGCTIGDDCMIAAYVEIGPDVVLGTGCRIQAKSFLPRGVTIGDNVFIGPGVIFCNDKWPPSGVVLPIVVEDNVSIGGGVVILPGVTLGHGCRIGAGAIVTKNVPEEAIWIGNPAQELQRKDGYRSVV